MKHIDAEKLKDKLFVFPKCLFARTTNNKTIDVSYAPQSMDAIEYVHKDAFIEKACEWLLNNVGNYSTNALGAEYMCEDFRKCMEE